VKKGRTLSGRRAALCLAIITLNGIAQTSTSQITGVVSDSSGAVVPGAAVTATNEAMVRNHPKFHHRQPQYPVAQPRAEPGCSRQLRCAQYHLDR
jgi:hypothetical protein